MGKPGTPYRPSNGQEYRVFYAIKCGRCIHDRNGPEDGCEIIQRAEDIGLDPPTEWVYGRNGHGTCTAFDDGHRPHKVRCDDTIDMFGGE